MTGDLETLAADLADALPHGALAVIDRLRGSQSRAAWLAEAALRLARQQAGHDPLDPVGWHDLGPGLSVPRVHLVPKPGS